MTKEEVLKATETAMVCLNACSNSARQFRSEIDRTTCLLPEAVQPGLQEVSDEISKIIVRLVKLQETTRTACLKGSK